VLCPPLLPSLSLSLFLLHLLPLPCWSYHNSSGGHSKSFNPPSLLLPHFLLIFIFFISIHFFYGTWAPFLSFKILFKIIRSLESPKGFFAGVCLALYTTYPLAGQYCNSMPTWISCGLTNGVVPRLCERRILVSFTNPQNFDQLYPKDFFLNQA
jgi:hypothetical protein